MSYINVLITSLFTLCAFYDHIGNPLSGTMPIDKMTVVGHYPRGAIILCIFMLCIYYPHLLKFDTTQQT